MLDLSRAHPDVLVLVGTQTGNSELVADAVAERFGEIGFTVHLVDCVDAYPEMLPEYEQLVFVVCTWSDGTFPDNTVPFFESLLAIKPSLDGVRFGVVGLGDRSYEPFYQSAAFRMRDALLQLGAEEVVPILEIEGVPGTLEFHAAEEWTRGVAERFGQPLS